MNYLKVLWKHDFIDEPVLLFSEFGADRLESRKMERYRDDSWGWADESGSKGTTRLGELPLPSFEDIRTQDEFVPEVISRIEFEEAWAIATAGWVDVVDLPGKLLQDRKGARCMSMGREEIIRGLLAEGVDDWVPLLSLICAAEQAAALNAENVAGIAIGVVKALLDRKLMTIGGLGADGHQPWPGDDSAVMARFTAEMTEVDWKPDTVSHWLANTERGDQLAKGS